MGEKTESSADPTEKVAILEREKGGNQLGFSLEFREQSALVSLVGRQVTDCLRVDKLELEVPEVTFPFDVSGGAEQFRHRRCLLRFLSISIVQDDLARFLSDLFEPERYGIEQVEVTLDEGAGRLSGVFRVGSDSAVFSARFYVEPGADLTLRFGFFDIRLFGWLPVPASTLVAQIGRALASVHIEHEQLAFLVARPVRDLLRWLLPVNGWKIPDVEGLRIDRASIERGRLQLSSARYPDELPAHEPDRTPRRSRNEREILVFSEGAGIYSKAESALLAGRLDEARSLYLGRGEVEPGHPLAARRLLEVGLTRADRAEEQMDLIRDQLARNPDDVHALLTRAALLQKLGDPDAGLSFERAAAACSALQQHADAILAHLRAGELLAGTHLDRAIDNLERILVLQPDHSDAMATLADLYERDGKWYRALRMHLRLARRLGDPSRIADRQARMGAIYLQRFDDLERSRKHLDAALTNDPDNLQALLHQAEVQQRRGQSTRAARLLGRAMELVQKRGDQALLLETRLRLAKLWEEDLDDPSIALAHYDQILEDHPDHLDALFRIGRLAGELDKPDRSAEAFDRLLCLEEAGQALPEEVVKSAAEHLGRIYMARPEGAAEARGYFARVVDIDPAGLGAWQALEEIDRSAEEWASLVDVLEQKAVLQSDPGQVLSAVLEAASLSEQRLDDLRRAERFYRRALELQPGSQEALDGLSSLLRQDERWPELEEAVIDSIHQELSSDLAAERWFQVGKLRVEHLGDLNGGLEAFGLAAKLNRHDNRITERLVDLYRKHNRHEEYVDLVPRLDRQAFGSDAWINLWLERARIQVEIQQRPEDAVESYQRVLEDDPGQLQAHRALADLYFESGRWDPARRAISEVFELAGEGGLSGPGRTELHRRLAAIELELGNRDAAVEQYRIVLSRFNDDAQAIEQIAGLLREDQKWEELAAFYARRAEQQEGEVSATLHTAAASIWWDKLASLDPAASQYQAAIEAAPGSEGAPARLASLQRLYAELGKWREVADVLRRRIVLGKTTEEDVPALCMALAAILQSRLEDPAAAADCWADAVELDPEYRPALLALAGRSFERGEYEQALDLGRRAFDVTGPTAPAGDSDLQAAQIEKIEKIEAELPIERRAALALDTARAAWELKDRENAVRFYEAHMEVFAGRGYADADPEAFERLELLLREARQYEDLASLYRRWLKTELMPDRHDGIKRALALLLFEHLQQQDEAFGLLGDLVREHPDDQAVVRDLIEMLRKAARFEQLARLLDGQWEAGSDEDERIERLEELAEIYQLRLHDPAGAIERLERLLQMGYEPAQERLAAIYRQEGMHGELRQMLIEQARRAEDPQQASSLWQEIGRLASDVKDRAGALDAFESAFEALPSPENRTDVLTLLRESGPAERLESFLARCASEEEDPDERRVLLLEHAEVCMSRLDRRTEALSSMAEALMIEPEESVARRAQALYEDMDDFEGVADMQEVLIDLSDSEPTAARRLHRLGQIYTDHLDAPERAAAAFGKAAELDPSWLEPNLSLAEVLTAAGRFEDLIEIKLRIAQVVTDKQERGEVLREAAALAFDELDDSKWGIELLNRAAELVADPAPIWLDLTDRLQDLGEPAEAADALERLVAPGQHDDGIETPAVLYRRIAALRQASGDELAAIAAFERTLRQEPSDVESAERLEALYRSHGRHEDLAQMLTDLASRRSGQEAAETWLAVARSWQEAGDLEAAESALLKALGAAPGHADANRNMAACLAERDDWPRLLELLEGLPDELLSEEELTRSVLACFEGISRAPDSAKQELAACRLMLRVDPVNLGALHLAARLSMEAGQADESEKLLRRLDEQADRLEADQRYELELRLANFDFARGRAEDVESRLKRCIEARPNDPGPRAFLHKLYEGGQRFADRVGLLLDEAERTGRASVRFEKIRSAAQLLEMELGDPEGAAKLFERVVQQEPDRLEAWRKLAELYRLLDAPEPQREALLRLADLSAGDERLRALRGAARLACEIIETPEARGDLEHLLSELPDDAEALDRLLVLDRKEGDVEQLERHLAQRANITADPVALAGLLRERARVLIDQLGREEDAIDVLERLRGLLPSEPDTLETLYGLYLGHERWDLASETLQRRIGLTGMERERAPLWAELAGLRYERLDDPTSAVEAWRQAAALDPANPEPLVHLRRLAVEQGDEALLVDTLETLAARAEDETEELRLRRSVGLLSWSLGRRDEARRAFSRVLAIDEDDLVGSRFMSRILFEQEPRAAVPHLRRLVERPDVLTHGEMIRLRRQLVEALADAEPAERIEALEGLLQLQPDAEVARSLAGLYREVGDRQALAGLLKRLGEMVAERGDPGPWIERAELLLQDGESGKAAAAMQRALHFDGIHRFDLAVRLAELQRRVLGDDAAAVESLKIARELRPDELVVLVQLAELYWSRQEWDEAAEVTSRLLELSEMSDDEQSPGLALRLGDIRIEQGQTQPAIAAFERALELDPAYRHAYERLEQLVAATAEPAEQAGFYLRWARGPAAGARRSSLYRTAARQFERDGLVDKAVEALTEALQSDSDNPELLEALALYLGQEQRWGEVLDVLQRRRELVTESERRLALTFEMGQMCLEQLNDQERAAIHFEYCLQVDPEHAGSLEELAGISYARRDWESAAELYRRLGDRVSATSRFLATFRLGEICESLQQPEEAIEHYRNSMEANPSFIPPRQNLVRLLADAGRWEEVIEAIGSLLRVLPGEGFEDLALELRRMLAGAFRRLLRFEQAAEVHHEILDHAPDDLEALCALKDFHTNRMEWPGAAVYLQRLVECEPESPCLPQRWDDLGDLYRLRLDDPAQAEQAYYAALRADPARTSSGWKLWQLLLERGAFKELCDLGAWLLETDLPAERKMELHRDLGRAWLMDGRDDETALAHYEKILAGGRADLELIEETAELSRRLERWGLYVSLAGQAIELQLKQGLDPGAAVEGYLELARVYQEKMQDIGRASAAVRRALEFQPRDPGLLRRLGHLYASNFDTYREAIEVFRELLGMDPGDPEFIRYLARLEAARGDMDRTACYYAGLRFLMPSDEEARRYLSYVGQAARPSRELQRAEWDGVFLHPGADCLLQRIFSALAPFLEQLFPSNLGRFQLIGDQSGPGDDPSARETVLRLVQQAAWLVSGRPVSVVVAEESVYQAWLETGPEPTVVLSKAVIERSSPGELAFFVTREAIKAAMGCVLPMKFSRSDLKQMLAIISRLANVDVEPLVALPATASQYLDAVKRTTPPDVMEMVLPLLRQFALEPRAHDLDRWLTGVNRTADRVGLLACGDLNAALSVLTRFSSVAGGRELAFVPDRASVLTSDEDMLALFRFAFSEQYLKIRQALEMAYGGPAAGE